jgi:hypothetical protein
MCCLLFCLFSGASNRQVFPLQDGSPSPKKQPRLCSTSHDQHNLQQSHQTPQGPDNDLIAVTPVWSTLFLISWDHLSCSCIWDRWILSNISPKKQPRLCSTSHDQHNLQQSHQTPQGQSFTQRPLPNLMRQPQIYRNDNQSTVPQPHQQASEKGHTDTSIGRGSIL